MEITEIRVKLMDDTEDRLRAFCSITFDNSFVVRDLKIIEGNNGPFVAMPSRKLSSHCQECRYKNHLRAKFCNQCGRRLTSDKVDFDTQGRAKLYADVAHPINAEFREVIQAHIVSEFQSELERAKLPGYSSRYDESYETEEVVTSSPASQDLDSGEIRRVDPAKSKLPAPHKPERSTIKSNDPTTQADTDQNQSRSGFGKGIFD